MIHLFKINFMKKSTFLAVILGLALFSSCSKEEDRIVNEDARRLAIREKISLHSKGLRFFFNKLKEEESIKTKSQYQPTDPGLPPLQPGGPQFSVKDNILAYLDQEDLPSDGLGLISSQISVDNAIIISTESFNVRFSNIFYQLALNIINVDGSDINDVTTNINNILGSTEFLSLPQIEKDILFIGAETVIDSYIYWSTELENWGTVAISLNPLRVRTKSFWSSLRAAGKADGKGAIAGAIGGAIGGAVTGAMLGGIGALPGAAAGAVGGGIATGVGNSILEIWNTTVVVPQDRILRDFDSDIALGGQLVPEMWTKFYLKHNSTAPREIKYVGGDFLITF